MFINLSVSMCIERDPNERSVWCKLIQLIISKLWADYFRKGASNSPDCLMVSIDTGASRSLHGTPLKTLNEKTLTHHTDIIFSVQFFITSFRLPVNTMDQSNLPHFNLIGRWKTYAKCALNHLACHNNWIIEMKCS